MKIRLVAACGLVLVVSEAYAQQPAVVRLWGSPQMGDLVQAWESGFRAKHPEVRFENDLKSTVTAVSGVYCNRAEVGVLGREIWPDETEAFRSVKGHAPLVLAAAGGSFDVPKATFALMVFAHKSNPVAQLSMEQLRLAFSETADRPRARTWGDLGVRGEWASRPIHLYGFPTGNDKAMIFRDAVFTQDALWAGSLRQFGNADGKDAGQRIIEALANDPDGLAISNVHYAVAGVKALPLAVNGTAIAPTREGVARQEYPLSREVFLVADRDALSPATLQFLEYVESADGQAQVVKAGDYLPLPAAVVAKERARLAR